MTPADAAAYAALDLAPGSPWPVVHAAWRGLVKAHHPDRNAAGDHRRLQEANAAYSHLCRRLSIIETAPGRLSCRRRGPHERRALWDLLWDPRRWGTWMPGVLDAARVTGVCDQRHVVRGYWNGRRFSMLVVITSAQPPCALTARVLELRVAGHAVPFTLPPRIYARLDAAPGGTDVELGLVLHRGDELPGVLFEAAVQAALVELLDLAAPPLLQPSMSDDRSRSKLG
jgi:hypothetical protein